MIAANYGSVADIEVMWLLIAVVGGSISIWNVRDAIRDLQELYEPNEDGSPRPLWQLVRGRRRRAGVNGRYPLAWVTVLVELARLTIQTIYAGIGVIAMLLPDAPAAEQPWRFVLAGVAFRWGLIVSSLLLTGQSVANRWMRHHLAHRD